MRLRPTVAPSAISSLSMSRRAPGGRLTKSRWAYSANLPVSEGQDGFTSSCAVMLTRLRGKIWSSAGDDS